MGRPKHPVRGPPPINRPPSKGKTSASKMKGSNTRDPRGDNPSARDASPGSSIGGCARDLNARTLYTRGIDVLVGHARDHNVTGGNVTGSNTTGGNSACKYVAGCGNATVGHALGGNSVSEHIAGGSNMLGGNVLVSDALGRNSGGGHISGRIAMVVKGMVSI
ncbi:hypothetical protein HETIRDRAFT_419179 [Heterobasidion irregulare TC 32-1]|uniref:Uncharacterized protein n=1 Tax=Heterobasidion irregulare (strain TC 32-1) TaxID=747525 RepID=W4K0W9_HETIT|nr:uncharacterized protein HETIRDRAFT_419179 [Heterobasidion irregulare TC 32-1]ETW79442.1 hypothetical protein HETIRDRAFT_419179 [Heterobasidion irregulare TC 32-1]